MTSGSGNTILLLHPPSLNPSSFLNRLIGNTDDDNEESITWKIDNKYYTAEVNIQTLSLGKAYDTGLLAQWGDVDVVLYIFEEIPTSLPPTLVKLLSTPRDIALAVRTIPTTSDETAESDEEETIEENGNALDLVDMFEEVGMEFIDEVNPLTEEDDERPMEPLEIIRQTLMTHIWPSMIRKPLNIANTSEIASEISPSSSSPSSSSASTSPKPYSFPETFQPDPSSSTKAPSQIQPMNLAESLFPGLDELRAEIMKADFGEIDKLDKLGNDFGFGFEPSQDEYARLDDWLDSDDGNDNDGVYEMMQDDEENGTNGDQPDEGSEDWLDKDDEKFEPTPPGHFTSAFPSTSNVNQPIPSSRREDGGDWLDDDDEKFDPIPSITPPTSGGAVPLDQNKKEGFDDDFEFTEFQSAPPPPRGSSNQEHDPTLALDPTPLLLHLQTVRSQLAGVKDDVERRERAGREVQQILASLGMGNLLEEDLEFEDL